MRMRIAALLLSPAPWGATAGGGSISESESYARSPRGGSGWPHDSRRESSADAEQRARPAAPEHPRVRLVERGAARRGARGAGDSVPAGHRSRGHLGYGPDGPHRGYHLHRSARQVQRCDPQRKPRPLLRADVLVAEHQHLPRPALGPRPGDIRRRSVSHGPHGRSVYSRHAGERSALLQSDCHREALRRA